MTLKELMKSAKPAMKVADVKTKTVSLRMICNECGHTATYESQQDPDKKGKKVTDYISCDNCGTLNKVSYKMK